MRVKDWPDIEDRGLWGCDSYFYARWFADRKMNYDEQICALSVDEQGRPHANIKPHHESMLRDAPRYGIHFVPVVLHLEQLGHTGIYKSYPSLKGQGGKGGVVCYSQPQFVDILSGVLAVGFQPFEPGGDLWHKCKR
jgi:hypothetical protein